VSHAIVKIDSENAKNACVYVIKSIESDFCDKIYFLVICGRYNHREKQSTKLTSPTYAKITPPLAPMIKYPAS